MTKPVYIPTYQDAKKIADTLKEEPSYRDGLLARITSYLSGGGLFNPELASHKAVRDLLIDCRDALAASVEGQQKADGQVPAMATSGVEESGQVSHSLPLCGERLDANASSFCPAPSAPETASR